MTLAFGQQMESAMMVAQIQLLTIVNTAPTARIVAHEPNNKRV